LISIDTKQPEFRSWKWIEPAAFDLRWLPDFKRGVYRDVLRDFLGVIAIGDDPPPPPEHDPKPRKIG
jgi:hypothetical protein